MLIMMATRKLKTWKIENCTTGFRCFKCKKGHNISTSLVNTEPGIFADGTDV